MTAEYESLSFRPDVPGEDMQLRIRQMLDSIEAEHGVRILYACESGSRAWGMASADSDCDVRFIYVRPAERYLCVDPEYEPDVIECGVIETQDGLLDCSGWDVRKALRLWHHFRALRDKSLHSFTSRRTAKLWLYALRAQLAMLWLEQERGLPPSAVGELYAVLPQTPCLREELASAIAVKRLGRESDGDFVPPHGLAELLRQEQEREESTGNIRTFAWTIPALAESHSPDVSPEVRKAADEVFRTFLIQQNLEPSK